MKQTVRIITTIASISLLAIACNPEEQPTPKPSPETEQKTDTHDDAYYTKYYANFFGCNAMSIYYLWNKEIAQQLNAWKSTEDPIMKVKNVRYKDASGKDIDKWSQMTDDFKSFTSSVQGVGTTYGASIQLYRASDKNDLIYAVIKYVSADTPAAKAGLKRGDVITSVNGTELTTDNYYDLVTRDFLYSQSCKIGMLDGTNISMTAVNMYEDPVLLWKVFDCAGKKVGYLCYTSFTLKSYEKLIEACKDFKAQGVTELILDLRYNGGGYVLAEQTLASMLAPKAAVDAEEVFERDIYNEKLAEYYDSETKFKKAFQFTNEGELYSYSTADANVGISKIYAILTSSSASASESVLVGLMPYLDVEILGEQSHGKYCTGIVLNATDWYDNYKTALDTDDYTKGRKYTDNWGLYVMISRYADKNGNTPCMPDGFIPDVEVADKIYENYQLGDERESMLRVALQRAGKTDLAPLDSPAKSAPLGHPAALPASKQIHPASFGLRIADKDLAPTGYRR